jgi:ankyrin repeat protein
MRFAFGLSGSFLVLLMLGCDNNRDSTSDVFAAIKANDIAAIRLIGSKDEELLNKPSKRQTPLEYAFSLKNKEAYLALLEYGADPDQFLHDQQTVTFRAAGNDDSYWLAKALDHGASPDLMTKTHSNNRGTPLEIAIYEKHLKNIELLVEAGADLNQPLRPPPMNFTALDQAASGELWETALLLVKKGADPHRCCEGSVFMFRLKTPDKYHLELKSFQELSDYLVSQKLDLTKAEWNGKSWDIPAR